MALLQVQTESGIVEGLTGWNQAVSIFRGIPYAAPPVGDLRWKEPQPVEPWEGVRQCFKWGNICYQKRRASEGGGDLIGNEFYCVDWPLSEDCLYLNVWTPAKSADEKLPVGVYFHGGGYTAGYGHLNCYDGEGFAKRGIITVTLNHRLGIFGYMAHPELTAESEHHASGNYGVLDLVAALKWVKRNIAAFGGDPEKITVFGQSGGGMKSTSMVATPLAKGLIRGAIMQSSGGLERTRNGMTTTLDIAEQNGVKMLESMGVHSIEEARKKTSEELLQGVQDYVAANPVDPMMVFSPITDGYVFPECWNDLFLKGEYPDIPTMIGCTADEMEQKNAVIPEEAKIDAMADHLFGEGYRNQFKKAIHYPEDPEYTLRMYKKYVMMTGGTQAADVAWCENQVAQGKTPAYRYFLTLVPPTAENAHHSAEHQYVFQTLTKSSRPYTGRDWDLSNQLADYWANFIKYGNPNGENLPKWTPHTKESPLAMNIDYELHMFESPTNDLVDMMIAYDLKKI
ncbi:carboxylesterase family protein [Lachnospiraceae bacterium CLA-AA-H215]|uniref:Carboxylic ester hydrolase n=1 Tax=Hominifimenecus microfluidus TaxID=2885348 RepID=A0AAE3JHI4_9FIRM|nr:carboxylesterase family protein [Hominifimenecus microfluidus]MCC2232001.1 carboxylesterase family protein [Hominifimenecus microfluidus]